MATMKTSVRASVALAIAAVALASCGGDDDDSEPATETTTVTETTTTGTDANEAGSQAEDEEAGLGDSGGIVFFQSPTGNIGCALDPKEVRCDIAEREWEPGPRPDNCPPDTDYGQGITLDSSGTARFVCAGDTVLGQGDELPYGEAISAGPLTCESAETGVTCLLDDEGGFQLSRQSFDFIGTIQAG